MGYDVRITKSSVVIRSEVQSQVFKIWCDLNHPQNDHLKYGGNWSGARKENAAWFSWMTPDYDKTCTSVEEILDMLGFDYTVKNNDIYITGYDSKTGQEDFFFQSISHLITGEICWIGEEGHGFNWLFDGSPTPLLLTSS
jgi:hypothetical protein